MNDNYCSLVEIIKYLHCFSFGNYEKHVQVSDVFIFLNECCKITNEEQMNEHTKEWRNKQVNKPTDARFTPS